MAGIGAIAVSCAPAATPTPEAPVEQPPVEPTATSEAIVAKDTTPTPEAAMSATYKEAPMLADMVKAGTLPPVEERLPADVAVTQVVDSIGKYGGTLRVGTADHNYGDIKMYFTDPPIKWRADMTGYEPGLAQGYEWSDDGKTFTLKLRKGVRWSDGEPYTSADWKFWWEELVNAPDQKLFSIPGWMRNNDGTPFTMEFPDEYTVVWKSVDRPMWIDPYYMAQGFWEFADPLMKPAHYLKQFHPKYTPDATWEGLDKINKW
ncbi:MAG: hypothetical protein HY835_11950, partial [Anaerolineae bacterium]|nr:hypothetical protein [Anaerolineae bacterium]